MNGGPQNVLVWPFWRWLLRPAQKLPVKKVEMNLVTSQGVGQSIGNVTITETDKGLEFSPGSESIASR